MNLGHSSENTGFGSHRYCALGTAVPPVTVGFFKPFEKPTIDSGSKSIVATPAFFIGDGAPNRHMANFHSPTIKSHSKEIS
jgi:hypothetical protein